MTTLALVVALVGVIVMVTSQAWTRRQQAEVTRELETILNLKAPQRPADDGATSPVARGAVDFAGRMVSRFDPRGQLARDLERARIPLKAGEYLITTAAAALAVAAVFMALAGGTLALGVLGFLATAGASTMIMRRRITSRRRRFEEQLPGALTLVASSLAAGHTFLRAIQMMCESASPPISEEFSRVVAETRLGGSVVDALDRMAQRVDVRDVVWVVQAIRIQQSVGGRLADLLHTLADFIRAREEVRREVRVLTAEGRISAWMLAGLAPALLVVMQVLNPTYMEAMYSGAGLVMLLVAGASVVMGTMVILRMVKIKV